MAIGTAKPSQEEMQGVKHFFIDHVSIHDRPVYDAAQFEKEAISLLEELFKVHDVVIMAGGSGLYANAVLNGLDDMPEIPDKIREGLTKELQEKGLDFLLQELHEKDPLYYDKVDRGNPRRVQRALEVIRHTGKAFSDFHTGEPKQRPFKVIHIGLERDRDELYDRINKRMDTMLNQGLEEEAKALYPYRALNALQTVGYKEIFEFMENAYSRDEMIEKLKQHSRQYAKRQMTWLKKDGTIKWFHPEGQKDILEYLAKNLEGSL
ncbi:MAG: tRNA dimethylallyltransferase [Chitinophagaceae bacterium]|nr:tRNA dimethylallyltransferase [Chitinophagaceae bacterium]